MLISSLFTMSVNAVDTIEFNGEVHNIEYYFWATPNLSIEQRTTELTAKELVEFKEALASADYDNYEIISGEDYEIKRVFLKHGYSIDFISLNLQVDDSVRMSGGTSSGKSRVSIRDTQGREVTWAELTATFHWTGSTVTILSRNIVADPNPPGGGVWSNLSTQDGGNSSVRVVRGLARFSAPGINPTNFDLWVSGDSNGNVW
jgi:hypothetical protein